MYSHHSAWILIRLATCASVVFELPVGGGLIIDGGLEKKVQKEFKSEIWWPEGTTFAFVDTNNLLQFWWVSSPVGRKFNLRLIQRQLHGKAERTRGQFTNPSLMIMKFDRLTSGWTGIYRLSLDVSFSMHVVSKPSSPLLSCGKPNASADYVLCTCCAEANPAPHLFWSINHTRVRNLRDIGGKLVFPASEPDLQDKNGLYKACSRVAFPDRAHAQSKLVVQCHAQSSFPAHKCSAPEGLRRECKSIANNMTNSSVQHLSLKAFSSSAPSPETSQELVTTAQTRAQTLPTERERISSAMKVIMGGGTSSATTEQPTETTGSACGKPSRGSNIDLRTSIVIATAATLLALLAGLLVGLFACSGNGCNSKKTALKVKDDADASSTNTADVSRDDVAASPSSGPYYNDLDREISFHPPLNGVVMTQNVAYGTLPQLRRSQTIHQPINHES